jgi:hypothetical protein
MDIFHLGSSMFEDFHRIAQKINNIKVKDFYHVATKPFILTSLNIVPMLIACSVFKEDFICGETSLVMIN